MEISDRKEQISIAYVHAVAATAGFVLEEAKVDRDGVDARFRAFTKMFRLAPQIEAQLKCTADYEVRDADFSFTLSSHTYERLRARTLVPRILIVMLVPREHGSWLEQSDDAMVLRHCCYWRSLAGQPERPGQESVTVRIRRDARFDVAALTALMNKVNEGDPL